MFPLIVRPKLPNYFQPYFPAFTWLLDLHSLASSTRLAPLFHKAAYSTRPLYSTRLIPNTGSHPLAFLKVRIQF